MRTKYEVKELIETAKEQCRIWQRQENTYYASGYDLWKTAERCEHLLSLYDDDKWENEEVDWATHNEAELLESCLEYA